MRNTLSIFLLSSLLYTLCFAQDTEAVLQTDNSTNTLLATLTVTMTNLDSDVGQVMVALYNTKEGWLNNSLMGKISEIKSGQAIVLFEEVPYGQYAISSFHDEDSNGILKTGIFGIPSEAYASSRGAKGMFGPPKWEDAIFTINTSIASEEIKF